MQFEGAVIKEQGVTFAIVIVKANVLDNRSEADGLITTFQLQAFGSIPVVLMAQNSRGTPRYYGRTDIVRFLSHVPVHAIPWKRYSLS
jgi:hypothetical protein